jgi:hypothetical protein
MANPTIKKMLVADLKAFPSNPRKPLTDKQMQDLKASLKTYGNLSPITFNTKTGHIIGGHKRAEALIALGEKETQVWCVELDEKQEKAAIIALNKISGSFDDVKLKSVFDELDGLDFPTGFTDEEISQLDTLNEIPSIDDVLGELDLSETSNEIGWIVIRCPASKIEEIKSVLPANGVGMQIESSI